MSESRETNRNNSTAMFGYDFQANAAIVIMLKNIKQLKSIRVEGKKEDIEICLDDDTRICAQAKAVYLANQDFSHVVEKFDKGMKSLQDAYRHYGDKIKQLIYVTNSSNPINEPYLRLLLSGETMHSYDELPTESQEKIQSVLTEGGYEIPTDKLYIHYIPFAASLEERYKTIKAAVNEFVSDIDGLGDMGIGKKLMERWQLELFQLSTIKETKVVFNKKQIIWPLILIAIENAWQSSFFQQFDEAVLKQARSKYGRLMVAHNEHWSYVTRLLSDYQNYLLSYRENKGKCIDDFISSSWVPYAEELAQAVPNPEIREAVAKIIMYNVLVSRFVINDTKEYVKL